LGMGLAIVSADRQLRRAPAPAHLDARAAPGVCWMLALVSFAVVSTSVGLPRMAILLAPAQDLMRQVLYGTTAFFFLLPGIFGPQDRGVVRRLLRPPVTAWLGTVSYGIYLWHGIWVDQVYHWTGLTMFGGHFWTVLAVTTALTLVSATASYRFVERPTLALKARP